MDMLSTRRKLYIKKMGTANSTLFGDETTDDNVDVIHERPTLP